jgi:hypothetical protein
MVRASVCRTIRPAMRSWKPIRRRCFGQVVEPVRDRLSTAAPGTIAALIASYMKSAEYVGLRDTSKVGYFRRLEVLRT